MPLSCRADHTALALLPLGFAAENMDFLKWTRAKRTDLWAQNSALRSVVFSALRNLTRGAKFFVVAGIA